MQIICISRGSYGYSIEVAKKLSEKTGYVAISREMLTDKATEFGIPVGKLEMTILKNRPLTEEISYVADMYKAFAAAYICRKALNENIIYHGRVGHLILPGLPNVLRIRAIADPEYRIRDAMERMHLDREKAKNYIEQVDEDIRRWSHTLYGMDWADSSQYDLTINSAHLSAENAASALVHFVQLPEFQATPSARIALQDLLLAAECRLALGSDERTQGINVGIRADKGNVNVTYLPQQSKNAKSIPDVLKVLDGLKALVCTVATTNILLIGEQFSPEEASFNNLVEISKKWNAAIEIVRMANENENPAEESPVAQTSEIMETRKEIGGILEDTEPRNVCFNDQECGVYESMDKLIQIGHAGGSRTVYGGINGLLKIITQKDQYSLVAVGDVFLSKGAARQRLKREMLSTLKDKFRVPVIGTEDLKARYLFGPKQLMSMIGYAALFGLLYIIMFTFQEPFLSFVSKGHFGGSLSDKVTAALSVAISIPFVAFIIGGFYSNLLKLIKME